MLSKPGTAQSPFNAAAAGLRGFGFARCGSFKAPAFVSGFDDLAMVDEPVEDRGCHLCIAEHAWPFVEGQIGSDDDRVTLLELTAQVEQKLTPGLRKEQITQLIKE